MFVDTTTGTIKDMSTGEIFDISRPNADGDMPAAPPATAPAEGGASTAANDDAPAARVFATASAEDEAEVRQVTKGLSYMDIYYGSKVS